MSEQPGNRIPVYPKATPYPQSDIDGANPKTTYPEPSLSASLGGSPNTTIADDSARGEIASPVKEEQFTIDTNSLKWPANTEAGKIAKRPK